MTEDLPDRIKYWLNEAKHDCFFILGPENGPTETVGAIKPLLMGDSEPFRAMLQDSQLAEKGDIRIIDVEPETFKTLLKCLYGGSSIIIPKLTFEESVNLLNVADKYLIKYLKSEIYEHMKSKFSFEEIFVALSHPICYEDLGMQKEFLKILKFDFNKLTVDDRFLELDKAAIMWILQQELTVKEVEIWNLIFRWAKHKTCSSDSTVLRSYIFDCLKYLRFLTMDYTEFWEHVESSKILLEEEINDICRAFVSDKPCSIEHLCKIKDNRYNIGKVSENIVTSFMETPMFAFIHCLVNLIDDAQLQYNSKTYFWAGYLWCVEVVIEIVEDKRDLTVYVGCIGTVSNWNCTPNIKISLINHIGKSKKCARYSKTFSPSESAWGIKICKNWNKLFNPVNGFIKDDNIILMVKIKLHEGQVANV